MPVGHSSQDLLLKFSIYFREYLQILDFEDTPKMRCYTSGYVGKLYSEQTIHLIFLDFRS